MCNNGVSTGNVIVIQQQHVDSNMQHTPEMQLALQHTASRKEARAASRANYAEKLSCMFSQVV